MHALGELLLRLAARCDLTQGLRMHLRLQESVGGCIQLALRSSGEHVSVRGSCDCLFGRRKLLASAARVILHLIPFLERRLDHLDLSLRRPPHPNHVLPLAEALRMIGQL